LFVLFVASPHASQAPAAQSDEDLSIQAFLQAVESAVTATNLNAWVDLLSVNADKADAIEFFNSMVPTGVTRGVVRERDRTPLLGALPGEGFRLIVDVFAETGPRGHISTWRLDIRRPRDTTDRQPWRVVDEEKLSIVVPHGDGRTRVLLEHEIVRDGKRRMEVPGLDEFSGALLLTGSTPPVAARSTVLVHAIGQLLHTDQAPHHRRAVRNARG
jgi:hypothetical protein